MEKMKTYIFEPEKKVLKQGYLVKEEGGDLVYEFKMLKQPLIGAMEFEFTNHLTKKSSTHKVGQTLTTQQSGLFPIANTKSSFKFDGKNIWERMNVVVQSPDMIIRHADP